MTLIILGQIPSGKNQVMQLWRNGRLKKVPNTRFVLWREDAAKQILQGRGGRVQFTTPVALTVDYFPGDKRTRDVSGCLDALFHLLVYAHVLKDDGLVHHVTWRRMAVSKFPKVWIELSESTDVEV